MKHYNVAGVKTSSPPGKSSGGPAVMV